MSCRLAMPGAPRAQAYSRPLPARSGILRQMFASSEICE